MYGPVEPKKSMEAQQETDTSQPSSTNEVTETATNTIITKNHDVTVTKDSHHITIVTKPEPNLIEDSSKVVPLTTCMTEQESTSDNMLHSNSECTNKEEDEVRVKNVVGPPAGSDRGVEFVVCEGSEGAEGAPFEMWEIGEGASEMLLELNEELNKILDPQVKE